MMKKATLILSFSLFAACVLAQKPEAVVYEASVAPVIDGIVDAVWEEAPKHTLDKEIVDNPGASLGNPGDTYWQALWTDDGIYVLLTVADDDFFPYYEDGADISVSWQYDKTELYFDVNYILEDGGGPLPDWIGGGNGHYQIDVSFAEDLNDGTKLNNVRPGLEAVEYAFNVFDPDYVAEYYVPFSVLKNGDGGPIDLTQQVGFDVYIVDKDQGDDSYAIAVWSNDGSNASGWGNMDDCGIITFDGAEAPVYIDGITLTGGEITENNGTLQIQAELVPAEANEAIIWSVVDGEDGGRATINANGVVTGVLDGTVTVTCMSASGTAFDEVDISISNQLVTLRDVNIIRNPNFDRVNLDGSPAQWNGAAHASAAGSPLPAVFDGVVICSPAQTDTAWHYQFDQSGLTALPDIDYIFSFVAWGDDARPVSVDFEDPNNDYAQYGASTDPRSTGRSWWDFEVSTEPTRYEFDVNFDQIRENTIQRLVFQLAESDVALYLDSFVLVSVADYALVEEYTEVTFIEVSAEGGASAVALGGTLQMSAEVTPEDADYQDVRWSVEPGTGWASIDENGILTGDSSGTVTVIASAKDDSGIEGTMEVFVSWPEGIESIETTDLRVYPNPAVGELHIVLPDRESVVTIFNSMGGMIEEVQVKGTEYLLDVSSYAPGLYFIRAGNAVARFVK